MTPDPKTLLRLLAAVLLVLACGVAPLDALQSQPPPQQNEYVPINQLPPQDQLPSARLLIGAYAFVLVMLFLYVASVARRLGRVQHEIQRLELDLKRSGRS
jgi:hypothetical protein